MKCNLCKKECIESELINGVCNDCIKSDGIEKKKTYEIIDNYNNLSDIVLALGVLIGITCGIYIFCVLKDKINILANIFLSLNSVILIIINSRYKSLILEGEAEKLKLLKKLNNK